MDLTTVKSRFQGVRSFFKGNVWYIATDALPAWKAFGLRQIRVVLWAIHGFKADNCLLRSSALTFYCLLAVVPVVAMAFGIAKGFGFETLLEQQLFERFPGQEEIVSNVIAFSSALLKNTKGGTIAGVGLLFLFWSVIKVLSHIESAFNRIWGIEHLRSGGRRFSDDLSLMLISPILVLLSGSATVFITTQVAGITAKVAVLGMFSSLIFFLLKFIPYLLIWLLFTVMYVVMPNTRVRLRDAIPAGILAGTAYQVLQWAYITFQVGATRYNAIYGSFAALPLFLIWLESSWMIVLFGAELSHASHKVTVSGDRPVSTRISPAAEKRLALLILIEIVHCFAQGRSALSAKHLAGILAQPMPRIHEALTRLLESGLIVSIGVDGPQASFQPAMDIHRMRLQYVLNALERNGLEDTTLSEIPISRELEEALADFEGCMTAASTNRLLKDLTPYSRSVAGSI